MEPADVPESQHHADHAAQQQAQQPQDRQQANGEFDFRFVDWSNIKDDRVTRLLEKWKIVPGAVKQALEDYGPFVAELRALLRTLADELLMWNLDVEKSNDTFAAAKLKAKNIATALEETRGALRQLRALAHDLNRNELPALERDARAFEDQYQELDREFKELEGVLKALAEEIKGAQAELSAMQAALQHAENQLGELQAKKYDAQADAQRYTYKVEELAEEQAEQTAKRDRLEAEIAQLETRKEQLEAQLESEEMMEQTANAEKAREAAREKRLSDEIAAINDAKLPDIARQLNEIRERRAKLVQAVAAAQDYYETRKSRCSHTQVHVSRQAERDALNRQISDLDNQIVRLETQSDSLQDRARNLEDLAEEARAKQGEAEDRVRRAQAKRQNLLTSLNTVNGKLAGSRAELATVNERIERTAAQLREARACLRQVHLQEKELAAKIAEDFRRIQAKQAELGAKKADLEAKNGQLAAKRSELQTTREKRDQAREKLRAAQERLNQVKTQIEESSAKEADLQRDQRLAEEEVERARKFVADAELNMRNASHTYANLETRVQGMEKALHAAEKYHAKVNAKQNDNPKQQGAARK